MRWIAIVALCLMAAPARADWEVRRDPFDAAVVRQYKVILARDPHDAGALRGLVAMYRSYRTIAKLETEYRALPESWATLVVLARLPRTSRADTVALWNRALKVNEHDARGWLAIGDLSRDLAAARDAYRRAAKLASTPRDKRAALTKLVVAARSVGDAATIEAAYGELIALAPKDGALWLERGNEQLAAGKLAGAAESFATAEALLATDPERRLLAMMSQAIVLERLERPDDAIAQYLRTLDKMPRNYHLGHEVVPRVIDVDRKRGALAAAIARFEKRWTERSRGHFEWATLGDLYKEARDDERAIAAYKRAVGRMPTEIDTQRKLIALLDAVRPDEALAQHEAAARIAPGDPTLQIELAKRYFPTNRQKAFSTLDRLTRLISQNVNVRRSLADLYTQWEEPARAIREYEAVAALEPNEPDHALVLGEAYWEATNVTKARAAWQRLAVIGTATSLFRHGEVLARHEMWDEAVDAYTKSLALDGTNPETWRGRSRAYDELADFSAAVADAQRAIALVGPATHENGQRERLLLVRALGHWHGSDGTRLPTVLARWRFAFERGDLAAGYLLVDHLARIGSPQRHELIVELYRRAPTDDALGVAVARSYVVRKDFARARTELERIAQRTPARAAEMAKLLTQLEEDRERDEQEARWDEEGLSSHDRSRRRAGGFEPDLVGGKRQIGVRVALGADVRHASGASLGAGLYYGRPLAPKTALVTRFEWAQRDDQMDEVNAFAVSVGLTRRAIGTRRFEVAAGVASRFELRYGSDAASSAWGARGAIGGDLTLELLPRAIPARLGLRFHQSLTDEARPSTLMVELGFEVR